MTEKRVKVRLQAEGGAAVKAEFDGVGRSGRRAYQQIAEGQGSAEKSAQVFMRALDREKKSFDQLRGSLDPTFAATKRYEAAVEAAQRAVRQGAATQAQANKVMQQAKTQYQVMETVMLSTQRTGTANAHVYRNLAYQLNQVGQQGAVTGDFLGAMAIQVPDILASLGSLPLVLAGGAFALGVSFLPELLKTEDAGKALEKQIDAMTAANNRFESSVSALSVGLVGLREKYGDLSDEQLKVLEYQAKLDQIDAQRQVTQVGRDLVKDFGLGNFADLDPGAVLLTSASARSTYSEALMNQYEAAILANEAELNYNKTLVDQIETTERAIEQFGALESNIAALAEQHDISESAARRLVAAMLDYENAEGARAQAIALQAMGDELHNATDGFRDGSAEAYELWQRLMEAAAAALQVAANGDQMADAVGGAADEAARLERNLALAKRGREMLAAVTANPDFFDERNEAGLTGEMNPHRYAVPRNLPKVDMPPNPRKSSGRKSRGGRRGGGRVDREHRDSLREAERIYRATRTQAELYNEALSKSNALRAAGLIDQDTHIRYLKDIGKKYDQNRNSAQRFFEAVGVDNDFVIDALRGQGDAWDRLGDSIERAAYNYLLFGEGPFKHILGGGGGLFGTGGFGGFLKGILSFEGGGTTPNIPRTGGLDGRGGFLAMLHGNETVEDHTRPGIARGGIPAMRISLGPHLRAEMLNDAARQSVILDRAASARDRKTVGDTLANFEARKG